MSNSTTYEITNGYASIMGEKWELCNDADKILDLAAGYNKMSRDKLVSILINKPGIAAKYAEGINYSVDHGMKKIRLTTPADPEPKLVKCDCGCSVQRGSVMNASLGTSCPDCYDKMS